MMITISNSSQKPIYEQITDQIKGAILSGELKAGDPLPSMRTLAQNLRVSLITTKRSYNDLENDGYIVTVAGKGCYVSSVQKEELVKANMKEIEDCAEELVRLAKQNSVGIDELNSIILKKYGRE